MQKVALTQLPISIHRSMSELKLQMRQLPQTPCPVIHRFANGVYAREITIPADTLVIGKVHRHECLNFLMKGEITVATEEGIRRLTAPYTFVSPPGTQKAAITHSEVIWVNTIATELTDPEEIEKLFVCDTYDELELTGRIKELEG